MSHECKKIYHKVSSNLKVSCKSGIFRAFFDVQKQIVFYLVNPLAECMFEQVLILLCTGIKEKTFWLKNKATEFCHHAEL